MRMVTAEVCLVVPFIGAGMQPGCQSKVLTDSENGAQCAKAESIKAGKRKRKLRDGQMLAH